MKTELRDLVAEGAMLAYDLAATSTTPNWAIDVLHALEAKAGADDIEGAQAELERLRSCAPSPASKKPSRKRKAAKAAKPS